jgi:hypothetical protein
MTAALAKCSPGVDWITVNADDDDQADELYRTARALQAEQVDAGNRLHDWRIRNYIGKSTRHCRYGVAKGRVRVELSGELADRYWLQLVGLATQVRRLDTKVDVEFARDVRDLARQAYDAPGVPLGPNLPAITKQLIVGTGGGQTCYVGHMGGGRLGRLYDKSAESRGEYPPNTWRWELQEKTPHSGTACGFLGRVDDVPRAIAAYVSAFYTRHGVVPWFTADSVDLPVIARRRRTDMSTYCAWLGVQVAPGVRRGLSSGHRDTITRGLGLNASSLIPPGEVDPLS